LTINGSVTGVNAQVTWSDNNAGGSFTNPNNPLTTYIPPSGINNNITLTLTADILLSTCPQATHTISVSVVPAPEITSSSDKQICEGEPIPALTVLTNSANAIVDWYNQANGGQLSLSGSTSYTPAVAGTYFAEIRDPQGSCTIPPRTPVTLTIAPGATVDAGSSSEIICENTRLQLDGRFGGTATGASWSTPLSGGNFIDPTNLQTEFVPPLGTYTDIPLILTAIGGSGFCAAATDTLFLTVSRQPKGIIDFNDLTVCAGDQIDLTGRLQDGATSPLWSTSVAGGFIPNPSSLATTYDTPPTGVNEVTIYLTTSDPTGQCSDFRDSAIVRLQEPAVAEAGDNDIQCKGEDFSLNGSISGSASSAIWNDNNIGGIFLPNRNDLNATYRPPVGASNIRLILSTNDPFGSCGAAMDIVDLFVKPAPTITPVDTTCSPDRLTYSFEFTVSDGTPSTTNGTLETISSNRYVVSGADANSRLVITVRDNDNCSSDFTVNNPNCDCAPVAPPAGLSQEICVGDPLPTLMVNVPAGYTADWYLAASGGTPIATETLQYQPTMGGVFYAEAREIVSGCSSTLRTEIRVTVHPLPPASAGPDLEICPGESVTITAQGDLNYTFSWSNGDSGPSTTVVPTSNQTYTLFVNVGRCDNSDEVTVNVAPEVIGQIDVLEEIKCNGGRDGRLVANITSGTPNFTYRWSNNSILREQIGLSAGSYWVVITDMNQCKDSVTIDLVEPDEISISDVEITPSSGANGSITMTVTGGTSPYQFNWQFNGSSFQGGEDIFNLAPGDYSLIISDANGCVFDAGTFTVSPFTSTRGVFDENFIKIYPNPTGGELFIKTAKPMSDDFEILLFDALGKLIELPVEQKISPDAMLLDLSGNVGGIYFLKIRTEDKETVRKVIIER